MDQPIGPRKKNSSVEKASDQKLLDRYAQGNSVAAQEIYDRYAKRIHALVKSKVGNVVGDKLEPEDIVQSVFRAFFTQAREGVYSVAVGEDLWNLLATVTMNKIRTLYNYHRAQKRDALATVSLDSQDPRINWEKQDWSTLIADILEQLPDPERMAIQLRMEEFTVAEIAEKMGRSKRTVERLLQAGMARLREIMISDSD